MNSKKYTIKIFCLVCMLFLLVAIALSDSINSIFSTKITLAFESDLDNIFALSNGIVVIEAENVSVNDTDFVGVESSDKASDERALKTKAKRITTTDDMKATYGDFSFKFASDISGHHYLWTRFYAPNESSDSIYCLFNKGVKTVWLNAGNEYFWKRIDSVQLLSGDVSEVKFWSRESGLYIDKFIITNDPDFQPINIDENSKIDYSKDSNGNSIFSMPDIVPPKDTHPRLLFMNKDIESIKERFNDDDIKSVWDRILKVAKSSCNANLDINKINNQDSNVLNKIVCRAFVYALGEGNKNYADSAISDIKSYLSTLRVDLNTADITRELGDAMMVAAAVYDWCYDRLDFEDKEYIIREMKSYALKKEVGYPPINQNSISEHVGEGEVFGHLLSCGIAVYDEEPELYNLAYGRIKDTLLDVRRLWVKSGAHGAGHTYAATRFEWELMANQLIISMGYADGILGEKNDIANACKRFIYSRLPTGKYMKQGDDWMWGAPSNKSNFWWAYARGVYYLGAYQTDDPYLNQAVALDRNLPNDWNGQTTIKTIIPIVLLLKPESKIEKFDKMPLSNKTSYPLTQIYARTNWIMGSSSNAAIALLDASEKRTLNHDHADRGSFQLYYKGGLAVNAGLYTYKDLDCNIYDWGSPHFWNYYVRTVSSNCMTVFDKDEEFWDTRGNKLSNDGGQLLPTYTSDYDGYINREDTTRTEAYYIGPNQQTPEFSFVKTNLTNAYGGHKDENGNLVKKVVQHERSMVFVDLNNEDYPAALVVFDNIESSDSNYKKTWNLNAISKPELLDDGFVVSNGKGKLVGSVFLPEKHDIRFVESTYIDGKTYPAYEREEGIESEQGTHRLLISPSDSGKADLFLNAMYVTDADNAELLPMTKFEESNICGIKILDRAIVFPKKGTITSTTSFNIAKSEYEEIKCLLTDIKPGLWQIEDGKGILTVYDVKNEENSLYFRANCGIITITPLHSGVPDNITYPEMAKHVNGDFYIWNNIKKELICFATPSKSLNDSIMVSAEDTFKSFGSLLTDDGEKLHVKSDNSVFTLDKNLRYSFLNGEIKLLKFSPRMLFDRLYINIEDFFKSKVFRKGNIVRLDGIDLTNTYNISVKSGDTKINSVKDINALNPLTVTAKVPMGLREENIRIYLALKNQESLCAIDCFDVDISKNFGEIELCLNKLPKDIASGEYTLSVYLWNLDISPYDGYQRIDLFK